MKGKASSVFTLTDKGKKAGDIVDEIIATGKRFICSGCGLAYATNSLKDFIAHCVDVHDDMIEEFVYDQIAMVNDNVEEQEVDDEPFDLIGDELASER